jgi:uncharacterized repeat protein (TIGR03803 family)
MRTSLQRIITIAAALLLGSLAPARAATMILHNFTGGAADGAFPLGVPTLSGSKLYGMASGGGTSDRGAIFSMNADGTGFGVLHNFVGGTTDGEQPFGALTLSGSKLYGMTRLGGSSGTGTLFSVNTDGTGFSLLHTFLGGASDGANPFGSLTLSGSKLYGMTNMGGSNTLGTIFSINIDGTGFSLLRTFTGLFDADGAYPQGSLTLSGSKLYGTAFGGGYGSGTVFSMNTDGTGFTLLHNFSGNDITDGRAPTGSLTLSGSTLYGTAFVGGSADEGVIFRVNTDGTGYGLLHNFTGGVSDGAKPFGSLALSGSTLYGTTREGGGSNLGTLFRIGIDGSGFGLLESFGGAPADGANPRFGDLALSDNGATLYGMTVVGGTANKGVVFARAVSPAVPEPGVFAFFGLGALLLAARRRN